MDEVVIQTRFKENGDNGSGISVYLANLEADKKYIVTFRVDDRIWFAKQQQNERTRTETVTFDGLTSGKAYEVICDIDVNGICKTIVTSMYARDTAPNPNLLPGGTIRSKCGILKGKGF